MTCDNRNSSYRNMEFCEQTPIDDFFTYMDVRSLLLKTHYNKNANFRCRMIGILRSVNGHFYLNDIETDSNPETPKLLISMAYVTNPVPSNVLPNAVQIFGSMQLIEKPVLFARILQVLNPKMAISLQNAIISVTKNHMAHINRFNYVILDRHENLEQQTKHLSHNSF